VHGEYSIRFILEFLLFPIIDVSLKEHQWWKVLWSCAVEYLWCYCLY